MKKWKKLIPVWLTVLTTLLCACGSGTGGASVSGSHAEAQTAVSPESAAPAANSRYVFSYQGLALPMNAELAPLLETLGEPERYFEAASCAFDGLDKTYAYPGFELVTYPLDGTDYISDIYLLDNSVATPEGITVGSTLEQVIAAYGQDWEEDLGLYSYTDGDAKLCFLVENDAVISVEYIALNDYLR